MSLGHMFQATMGARTVRAQRHAVLEGAATVGTLPLFKAPYGQH
jgi:hypothetical protein